MSVQVPRASSVTVVPDTVHTSGVADVSVTGRPELELGETLNGATPRIASGSAASVIDCGPLNRTLTVLAAASVTVHCDPVTASQPLQPSKVEPASGVAFSRTVV